MKKVATDIVDAVNTEMQKLKLQQADTPVIVGISCC